MSASTGRLEGTASAVSWVGLVASTEHHVGTASTRRYVATASVVVLAASSRRRGAGRVAWAAFYLQSSLNVL